MPAKKPKISVNKLGQFVYASPVRQKGIVKDQAAVRPPGFKAYRYTEARAACCRYFTNGFDPSIIDNAIDNLNKKTLLNDYDANDQKTSIDSLNLLKGFDMSLFAGFSFSNFTGDNNIEISGVDVKVAPDLIFRGEYKKKKIIGAVKIHFSKNDSLSIKEQNIVATILQKFIGQKVKPGGEVVKHEFIFSIDIFGGSIHSAPKAQAQIMANVEASCEIYKLLWNTI